MQKADDFFSFKNTVTEISKEDFLQTSYYLNSIKAFARLNNNCVFVSDYMKKGFEYVSEHPLFLCGNTAKEVKEMGYNFYLKHVTKEDIQLLFKIQKIAFDFYETIPRKERIDYSISYDFHLINKEGKKILVNRKLTPLFLTNSGKIWKAIAIVSLSNSNHSGNIKIYKKGNQRYLQYNEEGDFWESPEVIKLTEREREIIHLSMRGFKVEEIANEISLSPNTIKFHRKRLFEKLEVSSISDAISFVKNNNLT
ncbi:LuxR family transcriptional regulator [Tenacibaculum holothuriorum]|uniref:LuxR family transcriptional regulator n=1 Tax=Tenacibaculum holothuriorum TaxID=1635173 RepID=A0A1Y2P8P0_9FLAO|nr:helix-turn-helix transcriptional regulator [Tenacibaculum holothuriorum]OSY86825.1 LuxR family transcriptional regulator [Tenacibaculum holothuriorum]